MSSNSRLAWCKKTWFTLVLVCVGSLSLFAQETIVPYFYHAPVKTTSNVEVQNKNTHKSLQTLPFFEDFSQNHTYPVTQESADATRWQRSDVWINMTLSQNPPSMGVATFDGLTSGGQPYSAVAGSYGPADTLASMGIDLQSYGPSDSVYLSFFYEPMGSGDYPDLGDSLVLEFLDVNGQWINQWGIDGFNSVPTNTATFKQIVLPVNQANFFFSNFQFRFRNIATYGNNDHWHLDYIKLDKNRNYLDKVVSDESFIVAPSSVLKNYSQMPWNQFFANASNEWNNTISIPLYNNWAVPRNTSYGMYSYDEIGGTPLKNYIGPSIAVNPNAYAAPTPIDSINYTFSASLPSNAFCEHVICNKVYFNSGAPEYTNNDTLVVRQVFKNYFAYDDGTAEFAYGLTGNNALLAVEFSLNLPDTLQALKIHWAHIVTNNSNKLLNLKVWQSLDFVNGTSDVMLYSKKFAKPVYTDFYYDTINGFSTYKLDTPLILPAGTYYIGWQQLQSDVLNIGFDATNDFHQHTFYNTGFGWTNSTINGSLLMRPQFGSACLEETSTYNTELSCEKLYQCYPNPANNSINLKTPYPNNVLQLKVVNAIGQQFSVEGVKKVREIEISIQSLPAGIYIFQGFDNYLKKAFSTTFVKI